MKIINASVENYSPLAFIACFTKFIDYRIINNRNNNNMIKIIKNEKKLKN